MVKTVLYAEDDIIIQRILGKFINKRYPGTLIAGNGRDAFELYEQNSVDLIVTDLSMPVMSGFELIRKIRESDKQTPIIVTTAYRDEAKQLDNEGVIILYKPIDTRELMKNIEDHFQA
jgi:CheY-like chemotaxis protein